MVIALLTSYISLQVSVGDTIDIILEVYDDRVVLRRVLVLSDGEETAKGNLRYHVRRWKLMELPRVQN